MSGPRTPPEQLRADCSRCTGLCCVALPFAASADFAADKPAGSPCLHLADDDRCRIHDRLRPAGYAGCTVYDCLGAGQRLTHGAGEERSWRGASATAAGLFRSLPLLQGVHELLALLDEAAGLTAGSGSARTVDELRDRAEALAAEIADRLVAREDQATRAGELAELRGRVGAALDEVSAAVRAARTPRQPADHRHADLVGARLARADLRGADLRGALLIAADLREADLRDADLLGTDLRDADLRGADLRGALFLTAPQLAAARGHTTTRLPARLQSLGTPAHWAAR
ncbi:MAG TPA: pentapeptide repeat-containing protein [Nocardioidaceae bacterium]|nr:pentapeptide repeat-containing protein [Nocardioidaceae bacterium]